MSLLDKVPGELKLYIGGLFTLRRKAALQEANITHVVSVLRMSLDEDFFAPYKHLMIEVDDVEDENLLEHFPATNRFIQDGLDGGGGVFVHCAMGKSRSATIILAYLLSTHPHMDPDSALALLRESRPLCEPNFGFMQQLRLYYDMRCPATADALAASPPYQRWLYQREVESARSVGQAPTLEKIRFEDEHPEEKEEERAVQGVREEIETGERQGIELKCKKCRRTLARTPFVVPHVPARFGSQASPPPSGLTITPHRRRSNSHGSSGAAGSSSADAAAGEMSNDECAHHFIDPLSWMREELSQGKLEGKLECPNARCKTLVGKYAWHGLRCSCGGWEVPGISLAKGRVDEIKVRSGGAVGALAADGLARIRRGPGVAGNL
ncbi:phosphatases II [Rhizodiscina lignyota]|uniref:protein-tyrosine-phosphatase n=1 Tax=Rhizodiscina lignyota TaxID=1504668 RepID=A0A9P4M843_9PEZI|nr:phosphatases II [Rhizodiscina lignyota]